MDVQYRPNIATFSICKDLFFFSFLVLLESNPRDTQEISLFFQFCRGNQLVLTTISKNKNKSKNPMVSGRAEHGLCSDFSYNDHLPTYNMFPYAK